MPPRERTLLPERLYGILGLPLGHSLSPALHNRLFARLGHAGTYLRWEKQAGELPSFFQAVRALPIAGLSVTAPYKEAVIPFLDALDPGARAAGAVNTVYWKDARLMGGNTDVKGFLAPLAPFSQEGRLPDRALVLGAGGAARAALTGLQELAVSRITVCARNPLKAEKLARLFNCALLPWEKRESPLPGDGPLLIINATPLGMKGCCAEQSPLSRDCLALYGARRHKGAGCIVYDLVYNPRPTRLLELAALNGLHGLDGLGFFAAQAAGQLALWTGGRLEGGELPGLVRSLLEDLI
ncbi:shikimate dehydrogenase [Desulfovibrio sp. OttesenSCG-928-G11]|nr:shikimate dehydrogenase [Desulfovibrio sp. OttesenSCG-928-G11]